MRIDKQIKGEIIPFYVQLIPNTMKASVGYSRADEGIICDISENYKYILLPDTFLSPYISGYGNIKVGKLKLSKFQQEDAIFYNNKTK